MRRSGTVSGSSGWRTSSRRNLSNSEGIFAGVDESIGLHETLRDPGPGARFLLQGLNCAMIVAYCRPFSGNDRGAAVKIPDLPARFLRILTEEERWLHGVVMEDRDSRLAHSDSEAWEMEP